MYLAKESGLHTGAMAGGGGGRWALNKFDPEKGHNHSLFLKGYVV